MSPRKTVSEAKIFHFFFFLRKAANLLFYSVMASKSLLAATPRKLPFKDSTNKTDDLFKSAKKQHIEGIRSAPVKEKPVFIFQEEDQAFIFESFVHPENKACYCCGTDRIGEFFMKILFTCLTNRSNCSRWRTSLRLLRKSDG